MIAQYRDYTNFEPAYHSNIDETFYAIPSSVSIHPTYLCNQHCEFCYTSSGPGMVDVENQLSESDWVVNVHKKLIIYLLSLLDDLMSILILTQTI